VSDDPDFLETWTPYSIGAWYGSGIRFEYESPIDTYTKWLCEQAVRPIHINSGGCERP
jgi:hypothetical protein